MMELLRRWPLNTAGVFGDQLWTGMRPIKVSAAGDQFANTAARGFSSLRRATRVMPG